MAEPGSTTQLTDRLYEIASLAKSWGYEDVCAWIMKHMAREERASRGKRKRKAQLTDKAGRVIRGGTLWVPPELLKAADD